MKKISIIVPMYKAKEYIKGCVSSLLNQNLDEYEIILVDDCSPDDTYEYAKKLYGNNDKIRIIKQEKNGGPGLARNKGIEIADGEYIAFCDIDDYLSPNVLLDEYKYAKENDIDLFFILGIKMLVTRETKEKLSLYNENRILKYNDKENNEKYVDEPNDLKTRLDKYLGFGYRWSAWSKLYKKEMLDKYNIRFSSLKMAEDQIFVLESIICAKKIGHKLMYANIYRIGNDSLTKSGGDLKLFVRSLDTLIGSNKILKEKLENNSKLQDVKGYFEKVLKFQNDAIEYGYVLPLFRDISYETLNNSEDVNLVFKKYYGDNALNEKEKLFTYLKNNKNNTKPLYKKLTYERFEELLKNDNKMISSLF